MAARRPALPALAARRRPREQQPRLAVGGRLGHGRRAVLPGVQPGRARGCASTPTAPTCGGGCPSSRTCTARPPTSRGSTTTATRTTTPAGSSTTPRSAPRRCGATTTRAPPLGVDISLGAVSTLADPRALQRTVPVGQRRLDLRRPGPARRARRRRGGAGAAHGPAAARHRPGAWRATSAQVTASDGDRVVATAAVVPPPFTEAAPEPVTWDVAADGRRRATAACTTTPSRPASRAARGVRRPTGWALRPGPLADRPEVTACTWVPADDLAGAGRPGDAPRSPGPRSTARAAGRSTSPGVRWCSAR